MNRLLLLGLSKSVPFYFFDLTKQKRFNHYLAFMIQHAICGINQALLRSGGGWLNGHLLKVGCCGTDCSKKEVRVTQNHPKVKFLHF